MLAQLEQPVRLQSIASKGFVFQYKAGVWDRFQDVGPDTDDLQADRRLLVVHAGAPSWPACCRTGCRHELPVGAHLRGDFGQGIERSKSDVPVGGGRETGDRRSICSGQHPQTARTCTADMCKLSLMPRCETKSARAHILSTAHHLLGCSTGSSLADVAAPQ